MWVSIVAFALFHLFPTAVLAQMWDSTAITVLPAVDYEELASLTAPQRKARQLATILIGKPEAPITVIQKKSLAHHCGTDVAAWYARGGRHLQRVPC